MATVALVEVDDAVLELLVDAAIAGAAPDDVTPPLGTGDGWNDERVAWLRAYHRDRRPGLDGPPGEATWAVRVGDAIVGAVRLRRTDETACLETGIWLVHGARGTGVGLAAMSAVLVTAETAGATVVRADTTADNPAARALLRRLRFVVAEPDEHGVVTAEKLL